MRSSHTVYAASYSIRVMREMALSYGLEAFYLEPAKSNDEYKRSVVNHLLKAKKINLDDRVVLIGGSFGPRKGATFLEIGLVKDLIHIH